jgi:hypothetical protein
MARKLPYSVIQGMCKYAEDTEIPGIFALWVAISTVGATLGRNVYLDQGFFQVHPNTYIVLIANSACCRKSTSIGMAQHFLSMVNPKVNTFSQKMTPEALIGTLSGIDVDSKQTTIIPSAVGIAIADELSTLIDKNSFASGMIALLTSLYDSKDFEYNTRGRGKEPIKNPCLSILGGSTIHWVKEAIPEVAIGGGFTSRVIFVYKDKMEKLVPWPFMSEESKRLKLDIAHDLNEIAKMRGPFGITDGAKELYEQEYRNFYSSSTLLNDEYTSGYANRRNFTLLKLAMIISAAESDKRVIDEKDLALAIKLLARVEVDIPMVVRSIVSKEIGTVFDQIIKFMQQKKVVSRADLIRQYRHRMPSNELQIMLDTLEDERVIRREIVDNNINYIFLKN